MSIKVKSLKDSETGAVKKEIAKALSLPTAGLLSRPRKTLAIAVTTRRQAHEQQRQYHAALDGFLAEWVRQHLEAAGTRS